MKQVLQNITNGETVLTEIPCPQKKNGFVLISTTESLVSAGTERMLIDFGRANLLKKAQSQPDKVKMVLDKIKNDGLQPTIEAVKSKLEQPIPLGYCNVGIVQDGEGTEFNPGDRVVSNGSHAEVVAVPKNLCAKIPDNVDDESAAFTVLSAIALQGVRIANPTMGESVVVTGLGLIGLITVQLLKANGCRVLGIDFDSKKCALAEGFGAEVVDLSKKNDPISFAHTFSKGRGIDAVIVTASTKSSDPISQAATMSRKKGRIVLVGVTGLKLSRADFYEKELSFQVSCSYGPGRYDPQYEELGVDYPIGFVRWTEQRNFEAVLELMSEGKLDIKPLISHRYKIENAIEAYSNLEDTSSLGILLEYKAPAEELISRKIVPIDSKQPKPNNSTQCFCGFVGGGNYASRILIPSFKKAGAGLDTIITSGGISAVHNGVKHKFKYASTDLESLISKDHVNTIIIATRHNLHAQQVINALDKNKNVFVEKPLALTHEELNEIETAYAKSKGRLMVGFNRRFSPFIKKMKELISEVREPKSFIMTMNAGAIPIDHWTQDYKLGGGRIIGEACHYIDLMRYLADSKIEGFSATSIGAYPGLETTDDKSSITLKFEDGSFGTIHYLANGGKQFPKERIEVFTNNGVLALDNFKSLRGYDWPGFTSLKRFSQDKGQNRCVQAFVDAIELDKPSPIPLDEIMEVSRVSIDIANTIRLKSSVDASDNI